MTTQEFSIEFDILYNNLASNAAPPLNEYEKSVFLTKAQSDIVLELYSGRNNLGLAFESSEEVREYLSPILVALEGSIDMVEPALVTKPANIWLITSEDIDGIPVVPVSQDEYFRIKNNPFRNGNIRRVIRMETGQHTSLIHYPMLTEDSCYTVRGLKYPTPIILQDIEDGGLSIDGVSVTSCPGPDEQGSELHPSLHRMILDRAVLYAKQAYIGGQTQA